jgi:hypothetical protein
MTNYMKKRYEKGIATEAYRRLGATVKFIKGTKRPVSGSDYTYMIDSSPLTGTRRTKNMIANLSAPAFNRGIRMVIKYGIGVDSSGADEFTNTDLVRLDCPIQVDHFTLKMQAAQDDGSFRNWMRKCIDDRASDFAEMMDQAIHQPVSAQLALVGASATGVAKLNDDGTTYTAGQTDCRICIDNGCLGYFQREMLLDIREPSGYTVRQVVQINDMFVQDPLFLDASGKGMPSITVSRVSGDANCNNIVENDFICRSGEYNKNVAGLPTWFEHTTPPDIFGQVRTAKGNACLIPTFTGSQTSPAVFTLDDLRNAFLMMNGNLNLQQLPKGPLVLLSSPELVDKAVSLFNEGGYKEYTVSQDDAAKKLFANYGYAGIVFVHPLLSKPLALQADMATLPERIYILSPDSWFVGDLGAPETLGGDMDKGGFYRVAGLDGASLYYRQDRVYFWTFGNDYPQSNHIHHCKAA